ncbi:YgjP-like metallopeptidase domain-containing protein [Sulfurisoma sediminicola]|uniref:YgjP-like metallopeptidase domain-containing protein n=1 Tax=Sulfurisoma sediminicola TaxID=1381557 RepID=UPI000EAF4ED8|nr:YgjP-like metallopeptidase domain-containing protein [Sulfurisoma sediminicola]
MRPRPPQLSLLLDAAAPDAGSRWRDGASLDYLGGRLTLCLDTTCRDAQLDGTILHLPLPPEATPRQIQDGAEAWLRRQAERVIGAELVMAARRAGRPVPPHALSFAARASWAGADGKGGLRFHWRLIEQAEPVIGQVVQLALSELPPIVAEADLFAFAA